MNVVPLSIPEVLVLEPEVYGDDRGFFLESFNARRFVASTGIEATFVQDNHSRSRRGVLRGLHYQRHRPQGKLVRVVAGRIWDVAVDLRRSSPTFGRWCGVELDATIHRQVWVPGGFGHGFVVLSESADVLYKTTDYREPDDERVIRWDDPDLAIDWPLHGLEPVVSERDRAAGSFRGAETYP